MSSTPSKTPRGRYATKRAAAKAAGRIVEAQMRTIGIANRKATVETVLADGQTFTFTIPVGSLELPESSAARAAAAAG